MRPLLTPLNSKPKDRQVIIHSNEKIPPQTKYKDKER